MKHTVLFVDDELPVLEALRRALRREPFELLTAHSGKQALEILAKQAVDLVVADESMPEMTGSELLAEVRRKYPDVIRITLTGQASLEAAITARHEGQIYRFLTKPFSPVDLGYTLQDALLLRDLARQTCRLLTALHHLTDAEDEPPVTADVNHNLRSLVDRVSAAVDELPA
jgi:DNA-binding NtrC family response regulator